ncbi:DUF4410 domain-containing protein [Geoalkalibacter halelectricus]|uniref:DUF4410 domain-containing protein n=1 Tax=Geoalkalibacter halelectricus TaxID=2847045 RepID=A0ABY5ZRS1_9BACT|nr:DUF4410 domain-containing protein [Geoalkalibacter halelectricus]MDO3379836.1 DUF4410 domain-containing protein [Geoalkalibacter halelectricus]UWZ80632.1 DUF4410 domain-containing protein [Geoalkalibacter halelectricus]
MRKIGFLLALSALVLLAGCGSKIKAPKTADGGQVAIYLLADRGIQPDMSNQEVEQLNQVGDFMEKHFLGLSHKSGYAATLIENKDQFTPGPGKYLLSVKVKRYNPGNKAARILVGFGAGAVSMDTHYQLFAQGPEPVLVADDGVGSSRDWIFVVAKLNEKMLEAVTEKIKQL